MKLVKLIKKYELNIAFLSRIATPDGVTTVRFAIFDSKNKYKIFEVQYINNIILN